MFEKLVAFSLKNRGAVLFATAAFAIWGYLSFQNLTVEAFPDPTDTQVNVITLFPGQPSEEVERQIGLDIKDIKYGKWDTFAGAFLTCSVAAFIIIATGAALYYHVPPITVEDAKQTADAIVPLIPEGKGRIAQTLFAIGLFDAGFLGALCISLSSSTSWKRGARPCVEWSTCATSCWPRTMPAWRKS